LRSILERPDFELAGVYTRSETKVKRDAGELCGMPLTGIPATSDAGELLAAAPDCVMYALAVPDLEEICRILEAGVNIVTTCSFFRGRYFGVPDAEARIEATAQCGRGSGAISTYRQRRASPSASPDANPPTRRFRADSPCEKNVRV